MCDSDFALRKRKQRWEEGELESLLHGHSVDKNKCARPFCEHFPIRGNSYCAEHFRYLEQDAWQASMCIRCLAAPKGEHHNVCDRCVQQHLESQIDLLDKSVQSSVIEITGIEKEIKVLREQLKQAEKKLQAAQDKHILESRMMQDISSELRGIRDAAMKPSTPSSISDDDYDPLASRILSCPPSSDSIWRTQPPRPEELEYLDQKERDEAIRDEQIQLQGWDEDERKSFHLMAPTSPMSRANSP